MVILSVGIDIGTTTTQVIFAELTIENTAGYFSVPHISIVGKKVIYRGEVYFTPLLTPSQLNGDAIREIVEREYEKAGFSPEEVDTGAVIVTGESARKDNAAMLMSSLSDFAGEFVVSTAGPDLEAILAGKGSGAQNCSNERGITVVNLDIGGGTTNVVLFDNGETIAKGCLDIGGRLICFDEFGKIRFISASVERIANSKGIQLKTGDMASLQELREICKGMVEIIEQMIGLAPRTELLQLTQTANSTNFVIPRKIQAICFSGGVADCIDNPREDLFCYGDIGPLLGEEIQNSRLYHSFEIIHASETIRATVIGAGSFSTTVSGSTIMQQSEELPIKNVPALKLNDEEQEKCYAGDVPYLTRCIQWFCRQCESDRILLALKGEQSPSYEKLKRLARCIVEAAEAALPAETAILVALESDTAKALGQAMMRITRKKQIVCIDGVQIEQGDYVDLGRPLMDGMVIPVVVKTFVLG